MSMMNLEVYQAIRSIGVDEKRAEAVAKAIPPQENLATKEDLLKLENRLNEKILRLENKILLWMGAMFVVAVGTLSFMMKFFQASPS